MTRRLLAPLALVLLSTLPGFAHAVLLEAKPAPNGQVSGPDIAVQLKFNSRIDAARSRLTLVRPDNSLLPVSLAQSSSPATLDARITGLAPGAYTLRWQVLAADGHITRGEIPFHVR